MYMFLKYILIAIRTFKLIFTWIWMYKIFEEKIRRGKLRWLAFTNRFDNHKLIWALSVKYHSNAKWFGKQWHHPFLLKFDCHKGFHQPPLMYILKSWSVQFLFFIPPKCQVLDFKQSYLWDRILIVSWNHWSLLGDKWYHHVVVEALILHGMVPTSTSNIP